MAVRQTNDWSKLVEFYDTLKRTPTKSLLDPRLKNVKYQVNSLSSIATAVILNNFKIDHRDRETKAHLLSMNIGNYFDICGQLFCLRHTARRCLTLKEVFLFDCRSVSPEKLYTADCEQLAFSFEELQSVHKRKRSVDCLPHDHPYSQHKRYKHFRVLWPEYSDVSDDDYEKLNYLTWKP